MRASVAARRWLMATLAAAAFVAPARASHAAADPAPAPSVGLELSDKPPPGCCCIANPDSPGGVACNYGLHDDKCRSIGKSLGDRATTWTAGKCPAR